MRPGRMLLAVACATLAAIGCEALNEPGLSSAEAPMRLGQRGGGGRAPSAVTPPVTTALATWTTRVRPNDIAVNPEDGTIVVVDAGHSSIEVLLRGGTHRSERTGFDDPRSAAFLPGGVLLVGEAGRGSVTGYDSRGRAVLQLGRGSGEFLAPNDIAVHPDDQRIYVVDTDAHAVRVYQRDGALAFAFGGPGTGAGQLSYPIAVAIAPELGEVFVADSRNHRIAVFDADTGAWIRSFGHAGAGDGEFSYLGGLHLDQENRLYVVEALGGFVQLFDHRGGYIGRIGQHGTGPGRLRSPKAVAIDGYNRLMVSSFRDQEIELWGLDDFENPVDEEIRVRLRATPERIHPRRRVFSVVITEIDPQLIDVETIALDQQPVHPVSPPSAHGGRLNARLRLRFASEHRRRLTLRFRTTDVLDALPRGSSGPTAVELTGMTTDGRRFRGDLELFVVPEG